MTFLEKQESEINLKCKSEDLFNTIENGKWVYSELEMKDVINYLEELRNEFIKHYAIYLNK